MTDHAQLVENVNEHQNRYIELADNKASILLTAQLAFLGLFANALLNLPIESQVVFWSSVVSAGLNVVAIFLSVWVVYPRTPRPETGVIFWENITEFGSVDAYRNEVEGLDGEDARRLLIEENYNLASVASSKYRFLRYSLIVTGGMVILAAVAGGVFLFG